MKFFSICAVALFGLLAGLSLLAGNDVSAARDVLAFPIASVSAGASATNAFTVAGLVGRGNVIATCDAVESTNRTVAVTFEGSADGEAWRKIGSAVHVGKDAGVIRLDVPSVYLPRYGRVIVSSTNSASTVAAVLVSY